MYELMIFYNKECEERIYMDATQATHRMTVETPEELCKLWSALLRDYEGATYSIWDRDECILAGAYDPMDIGSLNDYFGETVGKPFFEQIPADTKIAAAEQILIDNGIERDEAATVLQALGYALLDKELYPDSPPKPYVKPQAKHLITLGDYVDFHKEDIDVCLMDKDTAEHYLPCMCYVDEEDRKDPELEYTSQENWLRSLPLSRINKRDGCPLAVVETEYTADQTDFLLGYTEEGFETREWANLFRRADWADADFAQRLAYLEHGTPFERPFDTLNMDATDPAHRNELCKFLAEHDNALVCEAGVGVENFLFVYTFAPNEKGRLILTACDVYARETEPGKGLASTIEGKIHLAKYKQSSVTMGGIAGIENQQPNRA